jgi:hypothetical protein
MGKKIEEDHQGWHWYKNLIIPTIKINFNDSMRNISSNQNSNHNQIIVAALAYKKINNHTILPVVISGN